MKSLKTAIAGVAFLFLLCSNALAQSTPNWTTGFVPSAAQWNAQWASKLDYNGGNISLNSLIIASNTQLNTVVANSISFSTISGTGFGVDITGSITASSLATSGTIAGSLCRTAGGIILYEAGVNCYAGGGGGGGATLTFGTHLISGGSSYNGSTGVTISTDATNTNAASTIISRDASGNFTANIITASLTGHASSDLALTGGTLSGELITVASATGGAGLNLPQGTAPTSPSNGDIWITSSGLFARIGGANVGPFSVGIATSITPGTTTVNSATAPCLIANSSGTVMACDAVASSVITAMSNAVNTSNGLTTFGTDLPLAGGTLTGKLTLPASATGGASFNIPQGTAPTSPTNGDVWTTASGIYARIAGVTAGPFGAAGGTVTTTGSPASGNLAKFSGTTSIVNGDLSGDCTTSGTLVDTCTKFNGKATAPTTLTIATATFTPDGTSYNYNITLTTACPCTLANPSVAMNAGDAGQITVKQSSAGSNVISSWGSQYIAAGGTIVLSTAPNTQDVLSYYALDSAHILLVPSLAYSSICSAVLPPSGGIYDSTSLSGSGPTGGAFTVANSASPDCATNGSTFVEDTSTGGHNIQVGNVEITHTFSSASATITVYLKQGSGSRSVSIDMYDPTFADLSTVTILPSACSVTVAPSSTGFPTPTSTQTVVAGGWCKATLTTTPISVSGIIVYLSSYNASGSYAGNGTSSVVYWGFGVTSP